MYDEIRKPTLLKDIPMVLIRSLPSIYYFNEYANLSISEKPRRLFETNINFIDKSLKFYAEKLELSKCSEIAESFRNLQKLEPGKFSKQLLEATESLSEICTTHKDRFRSISRSEKQNFDKFYNEQVLKLKIILFSSAESNEKIDKIFSTLKNYCKYDTDTVSCGSSEISEQIIKSDVIIFTSANSPKIHENIKQAASYKKPAIVLIPLSGNGEDRLSLRHGKQLQNAGFHVIIKSFTPIRLFTSIDKEYIKYSFKN